MQIYLTPQARKHLQKFNGTVTEDYLKKVFKSKHAKIDQDTVEYIQKCVDDHNFHDNAFLHRLLLYPEVLQLGKPTLISFAKSIRFVLYIWLAYSKERAYSAVFDDEIKKLEERFKDTNTNIQTLVRKRATMLEQSPIVTWLNKQMQETEHSLFITDRIKSFKKLSDLVDNAKSEFIQMTSAKSLIELTQDPTQDTNVTNINLQNNTINNGINSMDIINAFKSANHQLAKQQQQAIEQGASVKTIAEASILPKRLTQ